MILEATRAGLVRNKKALKELKSGGEDGLMAYIKAHMCALNSEPSSARVFDFLLQPLCPFLRGYFSGGVTC